MHAAAGFVEVQLDKLVSWVEGYEKSRKRKDSTLQRAIEAALQAKVVADPEPMAEPEAEQDPEPEPMAEPAPEQEPMVEPEPEPEPKRTTRQAAAVVVAALNPAAPSLPAAQITALLGACQEAERASRWEGAHSYQ
jgi:outer membrane biosynthesis protein TonB